MYIYAYFCSYYYDSYGAICDVICYGYEDKFDDCSYDYCNSCADDGGNVGISCSKQYTD